MPRIRSESRPRQLFDAWRDLHTSFSTPTTQPDDELFLRHTFIAVVSRAAAAAVLAGTDAVSRIGQFDCLDSEWFANRGIECFVREPDLFGWPMGSTVVRLIAEVRCLDIPNAPSDVLKTLHHALMSLGSRRGLGELYTPDWLAECMVEDVLREAAPCALLDPACGSGTFLFHAIRHLRSSSASLGTILATIHGADVNPLAVEMARANYLIALGPLVRDSESSIRIPVDECDSLTREHWPARYGAVIGNPPWLPLRAVPPARQSLYRRLASAAYGLADGRGEMTTHVETAALFLAHFADTALRDRGIVSFVMPRTVFNGGQHHMLRTGGLKLPRSTGSRLALERAMDCEQVRPLFQTPAATMVFRKLPDGAANSESFPVISLAGALPHRDVQLETARQVLGRSDDCFTLYKSGSRSWLAPVGRQRVQVDSSPYKSRFRQGATLVPRSFWFVDAEGPLKAGSVATRLVSSSEPGKGGPVAAYRRYRLTGHVEERFLFTTLLGDDVLPFVPRRFRTVFLPAAEENGRIRLLSAEEMQDNGFLGAAAWLVEAQRIWTVERGEKAGKMNLLQRLDHVRGLTAQDSKARWRVLYPNFQRGSVASVVDTRAPLRDGTSPQFVVDTALYGMATEDREEADYLCAVLNSTVIDEFLIHLRRSDQAAHPNVHKKLFDVAPIPLFDRSDSRHRSLAALGSECAVRVADRLRDDAELMRGIGPARRRVRYLLADELREIDALVKATIAQASA